MPKAKNNSKTNNLPKFYDTIETPVGPLTLLSSPVTLTAILCKNDKKIHEFKKNIRNFKKSPTHPILQVAKTQLKEYFKGARKTFQLPLEFEGTLFQKKVWRELLKVPYGQTRSYSDQARGLGDVQKVRAVASANGKNPLMIIAPCHRIIGKNGSLTGYAGGLHIKKWLLEHEKKFLKG